MDTNLSSPSAGIAQRQIRASYTADTITVYQAYPSSIATPTISAGRFAGPFKRNRMTWIKPSFLWMAYRSGWATKPGQEYVLAIEIYRSGFHCALEHASLSHYDAGLYPSREDWAIRRQATQVRVQWDPERDLRLRPLSYRSIQIGLSGDFVHHYVDEWTVHVTDVTDRVRHIGALVAAQQFDLARQHLPVELPYPLPPQLTAIIGATG